MAETDTAPPPLPTDSNPPLVAPDELAPLGSPCPTCGCPVEAEDHFCPACGTPHSTTSISSAPGAAKSESPLKHFRCEKCGSAMSANADQRSYICPFCDSTYVIEFSPTDTNRHPPEFVIGFAITPEQALQSFRKWIRENAWFRPGDLAAKFCADKQRGIYLPFWSFSMLAESSWSASIGEHWYRTETYTTRDAKGNTVTHTRQVQETEWWPLSGRHHRYYHGYLISGSKGLPQAAAETIMPFNLPALKRYEPYFLAGWLCEEYSLDRDNALVLCRREFAARENRNVAAFLPGNTYRNLDVSTEFSHIHSDLCLLPIYVLSYRYGNSVYRFLVNGQTGKYHGDKPVSWKRIWLAIGAVIFVIVVVAVLSAVLSK